jgi:hypothetical protein
LLREGGSRVLRPLYLWEVFVGTPRFISNSFCVCLKESSVCLGSPCFGSVAPLFLWVLRSCVGPVLLSAVLGAVLSASLSALFGVCHACSSVCSLCCVGGCSLGLCSCWLLASWLCVCTVFAVWVHCHHC